MKIEALFAGDTVGYDAERRLVQVSGGPTSYLANVYDGDGQRAIQDERKRVHVLSVQRVDRNAAG